MVAHGPVDFYPVMIPIRIFPVTFLMAGAINPCIDSPGPDVAVFQHFNKVFSISIRGEARRFDLPQYLLFEKRIKM
jgi:hypothetical protein